MNRLILIGNGFDLAHGLKTDFNSFIIWYLNRCVKQANKSGTYSDKLITVKFNYDLVNLPTQSLRTVPGFIDYFYKAGFRNLTGQQIMLGDYQFPNPFILKFNSKLSNEVVGRCKYENWVDIENEFYSQLKTCLELKNPHTVPALNELNASLKFIIEQLEVYLSTQVCKKFDPRYSDILSSNIKAKDIVLTGSDAYNSKLYYEAPATSTMILNFNYTNTIENYLKNRAELPILEVKPAINYIHGEIKAEHNPVIFGFGDELDDDYKKMEHSGINEFFEHIKSFGYFKTSNYHDLIRFVESDMYQVYILGHSCGLSDRTLLNMVFENENCKSIKIFYYGNKTKNNYITLTQEISRHFKDKVALRRKIVSFDKSEPMPQVE